MTVRTPANLGCRRCYKPSARPITYRGEHLCVEHWTEALGPGLPRRVNGVLYPAPLADLADPTSRKISA